MVFIILILNVIIFLIIMLSHFQSCNYSCLYLCDFLKEFLNHVKKSKDIKAISNCISNLGAALERGAICPSFSTTDKNNGEITVTYRVSTKREHINRDFMDVCENNTLHSNELLKNLTKRTMSLKNLKGLQFLVYNHQHIKQHKHFIYYTRQRNGLSAHKQGPVDDSLRRR